MLVVVVGGVDVVVVGDVVVGDVVVVEVVADVGVVGVAAVVPGTGIVIDVGIVVVAVAVAFGLVAAPRTAIVRGGVPPRVVDVVSSEPDGGAAAMAPVVGDAPGSGAAPATLVMTKGPMCTVSVQRPARSSVRRWNHHCPFVNTGLTVPVADAGSPTTAGGSDRGWPVHVTEYPRMALAPLARGVDHAMAMVRTVDGTVSTWSTLWASRGSMAPALLPRIVGPDPPSTTKPSRAAVTAAAEIAASVATL